MPKNSPGATITPHFREFLPSWVARQPWYRGGSEADPVWRQEILRLVRDGGAVEGHLAAVRGQPLYLGKLDADSLVIDVQRVLTPGKPAADPGIAGLMMGSWSPGGAGTESVTGCLTAIRS